MWHLHWHFWNEKASHCFFPTFSLFIFFSVLFSLSYVICFGLFSLLRILYFLLFSLARDEQILHLGTLMYRRMNDIIYGFVFQKIWLFLPAIWYTGFVLFHFPGALKDQQCCLPLVCAVACSTVWLSPGCFISVSL